MTGPPEIGIILHPKKRAFLAALSECGNLSRAAQLSECDRSTHQVWMKNDPEYPPLVEQAMAIASERLETEARRRAVEGVEEPVYGSGGQGVGTVQVGTIRKYSDVLLIFLMKGAMPRKYRENIRHEVTGKDGGDITIAAVRHVLADPAAYAEVIALRERLTAGESQPPEPTSNGHHANGNTNGQAH